MRFLDEYRLDQQRRGLSRRTIDDSWNILSRFRAYRGHCLRGATKDEVEEWLDSCRLTPESRYVYISRLHGFYAWLRRERYSDEDPTERIVRPRLARRLPRPISDEDLSLAMAAADRRMRAWLSLAAYEGFRCKEISLLQRRDILDAHDPPLITVEEGKGGHPAVLPLNPLTHAALQLYGLPRSGYVFVSQFGRPYSPTSVSNYISDYLHSIGVEATAHRARHWFGTAVWAATKDLRVTQEMLRHANPQTSSIYTRFDNELATAAVQGLQVGEPKTQPATDLTAEIWGRTGFPFLPRIIEVVDRAAAPLASGLLTIGVLA
jgi:integrase/recombinase XerC